MNFSMNDNVRSADCGGRTVQYVLTRKKVKNLNLRIKPDGMVYISAPARVPIKYIEAFIREKSEFIFNSLDKFASRPPALKLPSEFEYLRNGDVMRLWGKDLVLDITISRSEREEIRADDRIMTVRSSSESRIRPMIEKFYLEQTERVFSEMNRKTYLMFRAKGYDVPFAEIKLRKMTSRWGSCHYTDGKIVMNSRLVLYPDICAAYVFVHEYAHFISPDHSARFYEVLSDIMPDYRICKRLLRE